MRVTANRRLAFGLAGLWVSLPPPCRTRLTCAWKNNRTKIAHSQQQSSLFSDFLHLNSTAAESLLGFCVHASTFLPKGVFLFSLHWRSVFLSVLLVFKYSSGNMAQEIFIYHLPCTTSPPAPTLSNMNQTRVFSLWSACRKFFAVKCLSGVSYASDVCLSLWSVHRNMFRLEYCCP